MGTLTNIPRSDPAGQAPAPAGEPARWLAIQERARLAPCPYCGQIPAVSCSLVMGAAAEDIAGGDHLARWQAAERLGLITRAELADAVAELEVIAGHILVTGAAA